MLHERLGFGAKSRAAFIALDMGTREPTEAESQVLADWLGDWPQDEPAGTVGDTLTVPAALLQQLLERLDRQAEAITRLARAIEGTRPVDPTEQAEAREAARLEELAESGTPSPLRSVPDSETEAGHPTARPGNGTSVPLPSSGIHP